MKHSQNHTTVTFDGMFAFVARFRPNRQDGEPLSTAIRLGVASAKERFPNLSDDDFRGLFGYGLTDLLGTAGEIEIREKEIGQAEHPQR